MINNRAKRGKISAIQLFFIFLVSRIVVTLTYVQTVSVGKLSSDILISIVLAYLLTMLVSLPIYICIIKNKNPFNIKWMAVLYSIYFLYTVAVSISRFSYFATSKLNTQSPIVFYIIIITAAACYAALMGIEPIGRLASFCGVVLVIVIAVVTLSNVANINVVNYYPIINNRREEIFENAVILASNSVEPALLLALSKRLNGKVAKPLFMGITASFAAVFLLIFLCMGVLGSAASLQAYPIYTLFQMASVGAYSRLDMLHTAFWVLALFLKSGVYIYAAAISIEKYTHRAKSIFCAIVAGVSSIIITVVVGTNIVTYSKIISVACLILFFIVLPIVSLLLGKKTEGKYN